MFVHKTEATMLISKDKQDAVLQDLNVMVEHYTKACRQAEDTALVFWGVKITPRKPHQGELAMNF